MKKKIIFTGLIIMLICSLTACKKAEDSAADDTKAEEVVEMLKPENVSMTEDINGINLNWKPVENASGYMIYRGNSKYSDDYEVITQEPVSETSFKIDYDYSYYRVAAVNGNQTSELSDAFSIENLLFGKNTYIYSPLDNPEKVSAELKKISLRQETAQFGKARYLILFKPGEYSDMIKPQVGFYMEVCGLGASPEDTELYGLECKATWLGDSSNHNATCNFWRGVSNMTVKSNVMWAVSQATFMRRMKIEGNLYLHDNYGWASGGFLADSVITGTVDSGSQQQWLTRNSTFSKWTGENWNIVFVGNDKAGTPVKTWPDAAYTAVDETPVVMEKPYLVFEENEYFVYVPNIRKDSVAVSWEDNNITKIPLSEFYLTSPEKDNAASINKELERGANILFTPGIYKLEEPVAVNNSNTIIMGTGYATLSCDNNEGCMIIGTDEGVTVAGILYDAGNKSEFLLKVGNDDSTDSEDDIKAEESPIQLSDIFFRVGGTTTDSTAVESCVIINSDNVIGDNFWVWRADHGDGVAWNRNTAEQGIVVNGDNVTIYALMVEHFRKYQTVWNGNGGSVYFYQSELPYDVPNQNEWCSHDGNLHGYASYYVADSVNEHTAYGIGIYSYNRDAIVEEFCAMEIPDNDGMDIHNVCAVMITGNPGISHVINNLGKPCYNGGARSIIVDYQKERNSAKKQ